MQTLVEATSRTLLPRGNGDRATRASKAHVILPVLDGALEEALTRFARENPIMEAAYLVTADRTGTIDQLLPRGDAGRRRGYPAIFLIFRNRVALRR